MHNPGCFGIPSIFSFTSPVCGGCGAFVSCQRTAHESLKSASHLVPLGELLEQHERFARARGEQGAETQPARSESVQGVKPRRKSAKRVPLTDEHHERLATMPKKAADAYRKLAVRALDVKIKALADKGINPFNGECGQRPFYVAFECLAAGGFTRSGLTAAFMDELGWAKTSAESQVSIIWKVFPALGIAEEDAIYLRPVPSVRGNNSVNH